MPPPSPVRIHRAALNLSLPDDHDRQRFSRRLEQALRSSLAAIPDRLLPQVEETLHLGTLNLDLGELDLNNGSRLEGLFHERLQQRLLALLKQAARAAAPAAATAARSYPKPAVEPESGRSRQNPRSRAIASVRQQLQNLFRLAGQQLPAAGPAVADHNPKKQATTVNEIKALCADLASVSRGTQLPAELRTALAKLVTDLECWLSPGPDTAHALSEISECLKPLQQACAESTDAMGASDEQLLLQVLDKPLRASEPNQPVAEVSCIALEGVLKALVVRRQLSPAVAGRLGLWLARQAQLAPVLRLRRMQALHRYLRTHSGKTGELVTVLSQEDSVDGAAVEDHHPNTGNALSVTESGAVRVSELSEDSAQISTRDQDSAAGVDQKTPQPLKQWQPQRLVSRQYRCLTVQTSPTVKIWLKTLPRWQTKHSPDRSRSPHQSLFPKHVSSGWLIPCCATRSCLVSWQSASGSGGNSMNSCHRCPATTGWLHCCQK